MAASTSADSNNNYTYDVFINQRGPDTKRGIASHLYRRLIDQGVRAFLDRELQNISDQIRSAIRSASVSVAILCPTYAQSRWCLDELVLMLESGAPIIPVYYNVRPSELRWTRMGDGIYARCLQFLQRKRTRDSDQPRYDSSTIEKWRNALAQVADLSGFELETFNGDQGHLVDSVVQAVLRRVKPEQARAVKYLVGLGEKMKEFENKVLCEKLQVVGIVGVGGVGKTTLAKKLFDQKRVNYSKCCFLHNVREEARLGFLISLQRQLLKTLTGTDKLINSIDKGKEELKKHLSSCSILIIIDDVDRLDQINALLPVQSRLFSDSLVVITSRDEGVIKSSGVENASIYQLTGLNHEHSQELFCAYAFNQPNPIEGFQYLVMNFLKVCEGLPLFLRVFGALLNDKNNPYIWEEILAKLQQVPQGEAQEKLQISYQNLNREEQQIFLDSSCFFIGQKRDTAIRIWKGSGWKGRLGFGTLVDRCLLGVDEENNIEMHDHLRDFGRAVADTSSPRRLLLSNHIKDMLERVSGTTTGILPVTPVRGISMVLGEDNDDVNGFDGVEKRILELDMSTLELLHTDQHAILERILTSPMHVPRNLRWLRWNKCPNPSLPSWIPMWNLRVLQVSGSELKTLWEDESWLPEELRELEINAPLSDGI